MDPPIAVDPASRDELLEFDIELREAYKAATLQPDGRLRHGRKTKHDTATRRWCETVGFPAISSGKRPPATDIAMLRLTPLLSLSGADRKAREAWDQLHGRDKRSKRQTAAERASQQTLLSWARSNLTTVGTPSSVRRGRVPNYKIDFGSWSGFSPRHLALSAAPSGAARSQPTQRVPPGVWLTWVTGQAPMALTSPFKWRFPDHLYLYLALRELEMEGRMVVSNNDGPVLLRLPAAVHIAYEAYVDIRLAPADIGATTVGDEEHDDADADADASPTGADAGEEEPEAGALRVSPPPEPVERVEAAMPRVQVEFFKGILCEIGNGDRAPYKEWNQLTVRPRRAATFPHLPSVSSLSIKLHSTDLDPTVQYSCSTLQL